VVFVIELDSNNFSLKKIDQASMGLHRAVLVHCTILGFSGYIVLPNADMEKVQAAFSSGIIRVDKDTAKGETPSVTTKIEKGDATGVSGESGRVGVGRPDISDEGSPKRQRRTRVGSKTPSTPNVEAPRAPVHSDNIILPIVAAITKRHRRTKEEMMRDAAASNSTGNTTTGSDTKRRRNRSSDGTRLARSSS
jgi:hypothetical protein